MPTDNYDWSQIADGDADYPTSHDSLVAEIDAELARVEAALFSGTHGDLSGIGPADHHDPAMKADADHDHAGDALGSESDPVESGYVDELSVSQTLARIWPSATGQSIPDSTFTQLQFDTTTTDSLDGADPSNDRITIPADGTYALTLNIRFNVVPDGSRIIARIDAGGAEVARADSHAAVSGGGTLTARVSDARTLAAGDSVTGWAWQDTGASADLKMNETETFLAAVRIG